MRSNSGHDESRNNLKDPKLRDHAKGGSEDPAHSRVSHAKAPADRRESRKDER